MIILCSSSNDMGQKISRWKVSEVVSLHTYFLQGYSQKQFALAVGYTKYTAGEGLTPVHLWNRNTAVWSFLRHQHCSRVPKYGSSHLSMFSVIKTYLLRETVRDRPEIPSGVNCVKNWVVPCLESSRPPVWSGTARVSEAFSERLQSRKCLNPPSPPLPPPAKKTTM